jgi:hypothetical protein
VTDAEQLAVDEEEITYLRDLLARLTKDALFMSDHIHFDRCVENHSIEACSPDSLNEARHILATDESNG